MTSSMAGAMRKCSFLRYGGEQGFTLIEGMLAAALLSIGLLALSAMQTVALVKNVDSNELTLTTALASDMLERIQFNRRNAVSYNGIDTQSPGNCGTISPTTQAQAKGDCLLWESLVKGSNYENIKGVVAVSATVIPPTALNQRNVTVTITWMGSENSDHTVKRPRSVTLNRVVAPE
ncbi:MAG TPA: prepilin-type N-terminal cleavage/methylation domain-containing protein [Nitrospiraceae bacterium]|nr:prepilin-type N-terminal cleavage/methylation domain-containing protein [Nitrospiraceae bacterium]